MSSLPVSSLNGPAILIQLHPIRLNTPQLILLTPQGHNCTVEKHSLRSHNPPLSWLRTMKNSHSEIEHTLHLTSSFPTQRSYKNEEIIPNS